jgi:SAM-dependent methyltransferase
MSEQATPTGLGQQEAPESDYGSSYYSNYWGGGGPYERNDRWLSFFGEVADGIVRDLHPSSALDAGCAMGFLVEALRKRGVDAAGVDISEYAISQVHESVAAHCSVASLTEPLPGRYDLITCIEVLEHLPPAETDRAIANLCQAGDRILFSSTPGDYGEPTHLNVQPPETWAAKFAEQGFVRDLDRDFSYLSPWAALYTRQDEPRTETVRRYDRSWWRLRREVTEVRESLLQSQDQLAELEAGGGVENRPELLRELDARNEEILRLRDLLIGMEAEMGAVRGRVAELEDRTKPLASAKQRLEAQIPIFGKVIRGLLGLFRGQS